MFVYTFSLQRLRLGPIKIGLFLKFNKSKYISSHDLEKNNILSQSNCFCVLF